MSNQGSQPRADEHDALVAKEMTVVEHLAELRYRLLIGLASLIGGGILGWYGVGWVLEFFASTVGQLVFFNPAEAFMTRVKIAVTLGIVVAAPVILSQIWLFIMPALFPHERKILVRYVPIALGLFVLGLFFGFFVVYPVALRFFLGIGQDMAGAISVADHFTFFVSMVLPPGLAFQVPVVLHVMGRLGLMNPLLLQRRRRHVIFWSVVLAAMLTPSDGISLFLLAVPLIVLFEIGLMLARRAAKERESAKRRSNGDDPPMGEMG